MKMIIKIAVAVLIMAAAMPMRAQEWTKLNDTTWVSYTLTKNGVITDYAYQVDQTKLIAELNNDMRRAALWQYASLGMSVATMIEGFRYASEPTDGRLAATIILGCATTAFFITSWYQLHNKKVFVTPEGVIIKIGRTDKPKYDNKKARKRE